MRAISSCALALVASGSVRVRIFLEMFNVAILTSLGDPIRNGMGSLALRLDVIVAD